MRSRELQSTTIFINYKDIKKKINKNASELIKNVSNDSEKKQQSQESQEHMPPKKQVSEDISSRVELHTGNQKCITVILGVYF